MVALALYLLALASSLVVASPPAPPGTTCTTHTVAGMDSCHSIAKGANITVAQFRQYNAPSKIPCNTGLVKGTVYCVSPVPHFTTTMTSSAPGPTPTTCAKTYVVKTGNTCSSIVKGAGIRLSTLFKLNPQIHKPACDNLFVGEVLCIVAPTSSSSMSMTSSGFSKKPVPTPPAPAPAPVPTSTACPATPAYCTCSDDFPLYNDKARTCDKCPAKKPHYNFHTRKCNAKPAAIPANGPGYQSCDPNVSYCTCTSSSGYPLYNAKRNSCDSCPASKPHYNYFIGTCTTKPTKVPGSGPGYQSCDPNVAFCACKNDYPVYNKSRNSCDACPASAPVYVGNGQCHAR